MPALKPATIGQKFLTDCGQNRPLTTVVSSGECIGLHSGDKCTIKFRWSRTKERPGLKVTNKNTGEVLVDVSDVGLY